MKILLEPQEAEQLFHTAMCNVFGTDYHTNHGLELVYDAFEYEKSRNNISREGVGASFQVCFEDVLMQMLRDGKQIKLVDIEGDDEEFSITLKDVHEKVHNTPVQSLMRELDETGDVEDSDAIIQTVFFGEVVFG